MLGRKSTENIAQIVDEFVDMFNIQVVAFDAAHLDLARKAFDHFGKGRHPAKLNFGDCAVYATAKLANVPLLYVGNDFAKTDLEAVAF